MLAAIFITAAVGLCATFVVTPLIRAAARRIDLVDRPDGRRKLHRLPVPLGGGLAVLIGILAAIICLLGGLADSGLRWDATFLKGLLLAAVSLCLIGLVDDRISLRGRQKLVGQCLAAGLLIASGLLIQSVQILGWTIELGLLAAPFTLFWLLGAINSLNLLDGVDGLAASVGIVVSLALAGMCWMNGHFSDALIATAVAGSLLGFLYYNFPPASIFLGDAGSMLIGLLLGALAIRSSLKGPAVVALAAPTAIWAIPIFDVSMAILRRKLTGRSIYTTDRGHLHHMLLQRGYSSRKTMTCIGLLCAATAAGALVGVYRNSELMAIASVAAVLGTLITARWFGHVECVLLFRQLKNLLISLVPKSRASEPSARQLCARLQGTRQWDDLWRTLTDYAERFDLNTVQLNVSLPMMQEDYHAMWERTQTVNNTQLWHTEIPLVSGNMSVGRLKISGTCGDTSACLWMSELIAGLKPFEVHMLALLEEETTDSQPSNRIELGMKNPVAVS